MHNFSFPIWLGPVDVVSGSTLHCRDLCVVVILKLVEVEWDLPVLSLWKGRRGWEHLGIIFVFKLHNCSKMQMHALILPCEESPVRQRSTGF